MTKDSVLEPWLSVLYLHVVHLRLLILTKQDFLLNSTQSTASVAEFDLKDVAQESNIYRTLRDGEADDWDLLVAIDVEKDKLVGVRLQFKKSYKSCHDKKQIF